MAAEELHVGDIGTSIIVTIQDDGVAVDVSSASPITFTFCRPDATTFTRTGVLNTTGADGKVKYVTVSGDLDTHGTWKYQVTVTISGSVWNTDIGTLVVHKNIT